MILNIKELPKNKLLENNTFIGNEFYSYDKDITLCIKAKLSIDLGEEAFSVDSNTMKMLFACVNPDITIKGNQFIIKDGKKKYTAKIDRVSVPQFNLNDLKELEVDAKKLKLARKFTSSNDARPILTSVNVCSNGLIQASDTHVVYVHKIDNNLTNENNFSINIPNTFIDLIQEEKNIVLKTNGNLITYTHENNTYISKLIAGTFPELSKLTTYESTKEITFNKAELKECLKLVNNVGVDTNSKNSIIVELENDTLTTYGFNTFSSELDVKRDFDYDISFAPQFLNLLVETCEEDKIKVYYQDTRKPLIRVINNEEVLLFAPIINPKNSIKIN